MNKPTERMRRALVFVPLVVMACCVLVLSVVAELLTAINKAIMVVADALMEWTKVNTRALTTDTTGDTQ